MMKETDYNGIDAMLKLNSDVDEVIRLFKHHTQIDLDVLECHLFIRFVAEAFGVGGQVVVDNILNHFNNTREGYNLRTQYVVDLFHTVFDTVDNPDDVVKKQHVAEKQQN